MEETNLSTMNPTNTIRFHIVKHYLRNIFLDPILNNREVPVAIFCNKQDDLENCLEKNEIRSEIDLDTIYIRNSGIQFSLRSGSGNGVTGIKDTIDWLWKHTKKMKAREDE